MFGKKILGLVGLLFAGSQLISVTSAQSSCGYNGSTVFAATVCDGSSYLVAKGGSKVENAAAVASCVEAESAQCTLVNCPVNGDGDSVCTKDSTYSGVVIFAGALLSCTNGMCISKDPYTEDGKNYLVRDIDNYLSNKGNTVAVTFTDADQLHVVDIDGDVCVSSTDYEITTDRLKCFCEGNTIYNCENGVCTSDLESTLKCRRDDCDPTNEKQVNCADGKYYYDANSQKIYLCTDDSGVTCKAQDGENSTTIPTGYFINTANTDQYIQCNGSDTTCSIVSNSPDTCDGKKAGDLIYVEATGYRLCTGGSSPVAFTDNDEYLIKLDSGLTNAFSATSFSGKSIIIKVTDGNIVLENATPANGNYIVDANKKFISTTGAATLIQCSGGDGNCATPSALPVGYLKNALATSYTDVPYVSCTAAGCTAIDPANAADCSQKKPGDIIDINNSNAFALCVDTSLTPLALSTSTTTIHYMIKADKSQESNPFYTVAPNENNYYIVVKVTGTEVVVNARDHKKYRYANTSQRIYESSDEKDADTDVCLIPGGTIVEYTVNYCSAPEDAYDYYSKGNPHTWVVA